tara:strand:- start:2733 stop:3275 length:543 start_codon:yes stop_codon:yes gene_type:complete
MKDRNDRLTKSLKVASRILKVQSEISSLDKRREELSKLATTLEDSYIGILTPSLFPVAKPTEEPAKELEKKVTESFPFEPLQGFMKSRNLKFEARKGDSKEKRDRIRYANNATRKRKYSRNGELRQIFYSHAYISIARNNGWGRVTYTRVLVGEPKKCVYLNCDDYIKVINIYRSRYSRE